MPRKLLFTLNKKDFTIQTFKSGGPGGQHQNKTDSGVRIKHKDSGAVGESRTHKSQYQNKKEAFNRLVATNKFKVWVNKEVFVITSGKTPEEMVDEQMYPRNIKTETKDERGRWKRDE